MRAHITFRGVAGARGRVFQVPDQLPSFLPHQAPSTQCAEWAGHSVAVLHSRDSAGNVMIDEAGRFRW